MNYSPLEQFEIKKILIYHLYVKCPVFDVSITNGSITLLLILISYGLFNLKTIRSSYIIPSVWQFITESLFNFYKNSDCLSKRVLLYCYRQLNYLLKEVFSPITYTLSKFYLHLNITAGIQFDNWLDPQLVYHETDKDSAIFKKLLLLKKPKLYFWHYYWWKCFLFILLTFFIELMILIVGVFCFLKKQLKLPYFDFFYHPQRCWFGLRIPYCFFGSLSSLKGFNTESYQFSWDNLYRFITLSNCIFFIISMLYYIISYMFLGNIFHLSKLWKPGIYIFILCLVVSFLFCNELLYLAALLLRKIIKQFPSFFESVFFPLYYVGYVLENFIIIIVFFLVFKGYVGFLTFFFLLYIFKFWVSTSILLLSQPNEGNISSLLGLENYDSNHLKYFIFKFLGQLLNPKIEHKDRQKLYNQLSFTVNSIRIRYISANHVNKNQNYRKGCYEYFNSVQKIKVSDSFVKFLVEDNKSDKSHLFIKRYPLKGLDIYYKKITFIYPQYIVSFFCEAIPYGFEGHLKNKKDLNSFNFKLSKPLNELGVRRFHSSNIFSMRAAGSKNIISSIPEVSAKDIWLKFSRVIVDNRDNLSLQHIKPFLDQKSFMSTVIHNQFFDFEILQNVRQYAVSINDGFSFTNKGINNLVAKTLFPDNFYKDVHPSLGVTLKEGFSAECLKSKLDVNSIYRVGIDNSRLDVFLEYNNFPYFGDIYIPQYGTSSDNIQSSIKRKYLALNNDEVIRDTIAVIKQRYLASNIEDEELINALNAALDCKDAKLYTTRVISDLSFTDSAVIREMEGFLQKNPNIVESSYSGFSDLFDNCFKQSEILKTISNKAEYKLFSFHDMMFKVTEDFQNFINS